MKELMLYRLFDIGITIFEIYIWVHLVNYFPKREKRRGWIVILYISWTLLAFLLTLYHVNTFIKLGLVGLFGITFCYFLYRVKISQLIFHYFIYIILLMCCESVTGIIGKNFLIKITANAQSEQFFLMEIVLLAKLLNLLVIHYVRKVICKDKKNFQLKNALPMLFTGIAATIMLNSFMQMIKINIDFTITAQFICGVILLCVSVIWNVVWNERYIALIEKEEQEKAQLYEMNLKYTYYEEKRRDEERVRSIYHDMKNHLLVLGAINNNSKETQEMIASLQNQISDYENYYHTGNEILDIILRDKSRVAREYGIDFGIAVDFKEGGFIEALDISTLFGNALDNALEASIKLPPKERIISVKARAVQDFLSIVVMNNAQSVEGMEPASGTTKEDIFLHGFGLSNITRSLEKYHGEYTVQRKEGKFILKMIIPIPSAL